jgi:hypothetical protein
LQRNQVGNREANIDALRTDASSGREADNIRAQIAAACAWRDK